LRRGRGGGKEIKTLNVARLLCVGQDRSICPNQGSRDKRWLFWESHASDDRQRCQASKHDLLNGVRKRLAKRYRKTPYTKVKRDRRDSGRARSVS
jgi:hypothetical protein